VFLATLHCSNVLSSVEATGKSNAWATGQGGYCKAAHGYAVHWNGRKWKIVHFPDPAFLPMSVHASSPRNVWFFGQGAAGSEALRWDGSWHAMAVPQAQLWRPVVLGAANVWMSDFSSWTAEGWRTPLWHWDGTTWTEYFLPILADDLFGIAGSPGRRPWAVGIRAASASSTATGRLAAYRWDGTSWRPEHVPPVSLRGPAQVGVSASRVVWITGYRPARRGRHGRGEAVALYRIGATWAQLPDRILDLAVDGIGQPVPDGFDGVDLNGLYWSGRAGIGIVSPLGLKCQNGSTFITNGTAVVGIPGTRSFWTVGGCQISENVNSRFEGDVSITHPRLKILVRSWLAGRKT
jgi:hypothetical protein